MEPQKSPVGHLLCVLARVVSVWGSSQVRSGQVRSGQVRSGRVRSGQVCLSVCLSVHLSVCLSVRECQQVQVYWSWRSEISCPASLSGRADHAVPPNQQPPVTPQQTGSAWNWSHAIPSEPQSGLVVAKRRNESVVLVFFFHIFFFFFVVVVNVLSFHFSSAPSPSCHFLLLARSLSWSIILCLLAWLGSRRGGDEVEEELTFLFSG